MKKNLVLTGMMGVGKSTIGIFLSEELNMRFVDIDKIIENKEKMLIKTIFKKKGEKYFRKIEKEISLKTLEDDNSVIALGGGAFIDGELRSKVFENSVSFWLDLNINNLIKRVQKSKGRPLLNSKNVQKTLNELYEKRKNIYKLANFKINCNDKNKAQTVEEIKKLYEKH